MKPDQTAETGKPATRRKLAIGAFVVFIVCALAGIGLSPQTTPEDQFRFTPMPYGLILTDYLGESAEIVIPRKASYRWATHNWLGGDFARWTGIRSIPRKAPVKVLGNAFSGRESLVSIRVPDLVEEIRDGAFQNCIALKSITLPDSIKVIETRAFSGCKEIETVTLPAHITIIPRFAFRGCSKLRTIRIPDGVTTIACFRQFYRQNGFLR